MSARYLVQVRIIGGPWKTVLHAPSAVLAMRVADKGAAERRDAPGSGFENYLRWNYVRVTFRGAVVYDPRAPVARRGRPR